MTRVRRPLVRASAGSRSSSTRAATALRRISSDQGPAQPGRGFRRREAILDAATAEFLAKGYEGASLRVIMSAAGGSSRTLYQYFGDKSGLFRAVVARLGKRATTGVVPTGDSDRPIDTELFDIGLANISTLLQPQHLAFYRLMIAESATAPDLTVLVWNATHNLVVAQLAEYLRIKAPKAGLHIEDPHVAALQFIEASKSAMHLEALFAGRHPPADEQRRRVRAAVDAFLHGVSHRSPRR